MVDNKFDFQYLLEPSLRPQVFTDFVIGTGRDGVLLDAVYRLSGKDIVLMQRYVVSWPNFKKIIQGMTVALDAYERDHGPIDDGLPRIVKPN